MTSSRLRRLQRLLENARGELNQNRVQLATAIAEEQRADEYRQIAAANLQGYLASCAASLSRGASAAEWNASAQWQARLMLEIDVSVARCFEAASQVSRARDVVTASHRRVETFERLIERIRQAQATHESRVLRRAEDEWASLRASRTSA